MRHEIKGAREHICPHLAYVHVRAKHALTHRPIVYAKHPQDTHAEQEANLIRWWEQQRLRAIREAEKARIRAELAARTSPPPPSPPPAPWSAAGHDDGPGLGKQGNRTRREKRTRRKAEAAAKHAASAQKRSAGPPQGRGREECFTVYD